MGKRKKGEVVEEEEKVTEDPVVAVTGLLPSIAIELGLYTSETLVAELNRRGYQRGGNDGN